jgi:hypothetical protein
MSPLKQNGDFLDNGWNDLYLILIIFADHLPKQNYLGSTVRKIMVHELGVQKQNVYFVETSSTGWPDLIVVWYSVTNSSLQSNN